jgi:formylglycine-generating enzyme required for sulfatase activity
MDWGLARIVGRADPLDLRIAPHGSTAQLLTERAESTDSDSPLLTMDGHVVGTPAYMSPEQAHGRLGEVGPHSDVYAAGALLYQLLAGHPPYLKPGMQLSSYAIWYRVQEGPPDPLSERVPDAPPELVAICEKAMSRGWHARYRDMGELAADLTAYLEGRVVRAYEGGALAELKKWVRRNRPLAVSLGTAAGMLVAGLLALVLKAQSDRRAALAKEREGVARAEQTLARTKALRERMNVMRLSALRRLGDLEAEAAGLWSLDPRDYDPWLASARDLIAGLETHGELIGHKEQLARLHERALPRTEEARRSHPRFGELERLRAKAAALRRAQDVREGRAEPAETRPSDWILALASQPSAADDLNNYAWPLIAPDRQEFGREAEGLAVARLAIERVADDESAALVGDTLAWALFANGLDEEALVESRAAAVIAGHAKVAELKEYLARLEFEIADAQDGSPLAEVQQRIEALEEEMSASWVFEREEDAWWHEQLQELVARLEAFADPKTGLVEGSSNEHGWGIARRRQWAERAMERSLTAPEAQRAWSEAIAAIADPVRSPSYAELALEPQIGLLPLGPDPRSGLWEFAHLPSGEPARRGSDGELVQDQNTGIVLVLLPGGTFWMGAQREEPNGRNHDPRAETEEGRVHAVTLSPFFLSKYEMTQAQWIGFTGSQAHVWVREPVDMVSWTESERVLRRLGLSLPTEAQWEYAARGGTESPWWTEPEQLSSAGVAGERSAAHEVHGRANPFGLHDVFDGVLEWCLDGHEPLFYWRSPSRDPLHDPAEASFRAIRGVSGDGGLWTVRPSQRTAGIPDRLYDKLGIRPARTLFSSASSTAPPSSSR